MTMPKRHHYVPQFYLERFVDASGHLWLWDRSKDHAFYTSPSNVAVESHFYRLDQYAHRAPDASGEMERQLAEMEGNVSLITDQWLDWLRDKRYFERLRIPKINREEFSYFFAIQILRTADQRRLMESFLEDEGGVALPTDLARRAIAIRELHTEMLWNKSLVSSLAEKVRKAIWVFARNTTEVPFVTSDNPIAFRTEDNAMWVKVGFFQHGTYAAYPLAPDLILYMYPRYGKWKPLAKFDRCVSPVTLTPEMVNDENTAHVFLASRFVVSRQNSFENERRFSPSIGTDMFARHLRSSNEA